MALSKICEILGFCGACMPSLTNPQGPQISHFACIAQIGELATLPVQSADSIPRAHEPSRCRVQVGFASRNGNLVSIKLSVPTRVAVADTAPRVVNRANRDWNSKPLDEKRTNREQYRRRRLRSERAVHANRILSP
jgi:hypothetical protein